MIELPDFSPLGVVQSQAVASGKQYRTLDQLLIVLPQRPTPELFRGLPQGRQLKTLLSRAPEKDTPIVSTRLGNARATGLTCSIFAADTSFAGLTWARKLIAEGSKDDPAKLGLLVVGFADDERDRVIRYLVAAAAAAAFSLPAFKTSKSAKPARLRSLRIFAAKPRIDLGLTLAEAKGNNIARWLTGLPPNVLTASAYREIAVSLARRHSLAAEFLDEKALAKLKAGAFLAVSQGNAERDAGILRLKYRPAREKRPELALVGKGVIFDTGGTNLKPFKGMLDMHTDMQGSAVALGTAIALADLAVAYPFDVWLAVTENRLSAEAYKSQDVVYAANGTSIQVIHTDAEGRMALADTLCLAARENPLLIVDYATLTGSCVVALTERYSGVFSNSAGVYPLLQDAGTASGERVWPFPMDEDFDEALRSDVADIKQCAADGSGDHILAARFLSRFVPGAIPWIHVDLSAGQHKGGLAHVPSEITGFGVRLTLELLHRRSQSPRAFLEQLGK